MMFRTAMLLITVISSPLFAAEVKNCDPAAGKISDGCPIPQPLPWWKCDAWPSEERQIPTVEQQHRLERFGIGIFSPELPGDPSSAISHKTLLKHFGQPFSAKTNERLAYDPGDPMAIITNWRYLGFRFTTVASKPKPDELGIEEGEISGANVSLLFGVGVGQPIDQWVKIFGRPKCSESQGANSKEFTLVYEPEGESFIPCSVGSCLVNYYIRITLDASGKVKRMNWSYPMM